MTHFDPQPHRDRPPTLSQMRAERAAAQAKLAAERKSQAERAAAILEARAAILSDL